MATDNRTMLNDCEDNTGWSGDDTANAISTTGSFIEGAGALSTQLSNTSEHMLTTEDTVGATTFSIDMSDTTVYMNIKDNLGNTYANGGIQFVIGDGTDSIGYDVGGNDAIGMPHQLFFSAFKLDVSEVVTTPGGFTNHAGTEANLDQTAITQIGYGSLHLAKAVGSIDNIIMDGFYYILNDSYALTIDSGTSGTPETMADVFTDDTTNGWGLVSNPLGLQYQFFGPTEFGDNGGVSDHYFTATGEQWFWIGDNAGGRAIAAGNFPFRLTAHASTTGSFVIDSVVVVNTGTAGAFDCSDTNFDTVEIDACSFTGLASFDTPPSGGTSRHIQTTTFSECGLITHNGCTVAGCTITNGTASASFAMDISDVSTVSDCAFNGDGSSYGIELTGTAASVTLTDIIFTGHDAGSVGSPVTPTTTGNEAVYVNIGTGTVTLNVSGGTVPSVRSAGATVNVVASTTVTLTGLVANTEVRVYDAGDGSEIAGVENSGTSFAFGDAAANVVDIRIFHVMYEPADIEGYTIPASATSVPIQQQFDRNYENP